MIHNARCHLIYAFRVDELNNGNSDTNYPSEDDHEGGGIDGSESDPSSLSKSNSEYSDTKDDQSSHGSQDDVQSSNSSEDKEEPTDSWLKELGLDMYTGKKERCYA